MGTGLPTETVTSEPPHGPFTYDQHHFKVRDDIKISQTACSKSRVRLWLQVGIQHTEHTVNRAAQADI